MKINNALKGTAMIIVAIMLTTGCKHEKPVTVDPAIVLAYGKDASEQNLDNLAKHYSTVINKNRKTGMKQPGLFSDYAVALAKQGKKSEANSWFNREMADFPSSRKYVLQLKQELIPEYVNDNTIRNEESGAANEESVLSPAARAEAEEKAASVMGKSEDGMGLMPLPEKEEPVVSSDTSSASPNPMESLTESPETPPELQEGSSENLEAPVENIVIPTDNQETPAEPSDEEELKQ